MWDENLEKETKYRQLLTQLEVEEKKSLRKEVKKRNHSIPYDSS